MKRLLKWYAILLLTGTVVGGSWIMYQRVQRDAQGLRLCRTAEHLVGEYAKFRDYASRIPDDGILEKLMDREIFLPRAIKFQVLVDALKQEAPEKFPTASGFAAPDPALDSKGLAKRMKGWSEELSTRYRCPELLVPEEYFQDHVVTRPRVAYQAAAWDKVFGPALERNKQTAGQYREFIRRDTRVLCRSREGLAKAEKVHDYLLARCDKAGRRKNTRLQCEEPTRRSRRQVEELARVVQVNEAKFREKWGVWMKSTRVECAGRS